MSFWETAAAAMPDEPEPRGAQLPGDAYVVGETATENNGSAAPAASVFTDKEGNAWLKFKTGLLTKGGDSKTSAATHKDSMVWLDLFARPGEEDLKRNPGAQLSPRVVGLFNNFFATDVAHDEKDDKARSAARSAVTLKVLRQTAEGLGLTLDQYEGDVAMFFCALAAEALKKEPKRLVFKTKLVTINKKTKEKLDNPRIELTSPEDYLPEVLEKRKITLFDAPTVGF